MFSVDFQIPKYRHQMHFSPDKYFPENRFLYSTDETEIKI